MFVICNIVFNSYIYKYSFKFIECIAITYLIIRQSINIIKLFFKYFLDLSFLIISFPNIIWILQYKVIKQICNNVKYYEVSSNDT